ncbi:MAG TPA: transporter substrate-binding domain-containing protein [Acholeplasmataceae bacterium]|nr:transporter substrate-binding domain-containing protein [Acholeplasmataceae bacterium]
MKKLIKLIVAVFCLLGTTSCKTSDTLIVYTEAGFAPFEYISDGKIVGVDIDIMNKVGVKLGKKIKFENVNFDVIVDTVAAGKLANIGAAGLSVTPERLSKVDFSKVYYQANLYVIYEVKNESNLKHLMSDGNFGIYWSSLKSDKGIGVQTGTTADLFLSDEVKEGGILEGNKVNYFSSLDTAVSDIGLNSDYVIIDELPAKKLVQGKANLNCLPLYYKGEEDQLAFDEYAICVTKGHTALLNAINEVLDELLNEEENGINGIQALINKHLGL